MKRRIRSHGITAVFAACLVSRALGAGYYVSPTGKDDNTGTKDAPFATLARGQTAAEAGDTVFIRGGNYLFQSATDEIGVLLDKSGAPSKRICYFAYAGEKPVFDFQGMTALKRIKGVSVTGSWLHIKGIEMKGVPQSAALKAHENWCIHVNKGGDNIFELLDLHHNMGPGLFILEGANNLVLNCDSHDNYDANSYAGEVPAPGENADGFGFHGRSAASSGTVFRGCRAWWNADDGFDFIAAATAVTVENCWAWNNGYKPGTTQSAGNGNGFKVGGFGMPPAAPAVIPRHTVRFSVAFNNKAAGIYQNHHPAPNYYYNNTAFNNKAANFNLLGYDLGKSADASMGVLRNNIAFTGSALSNATTGGGVDAANNTWNLSVTVTAADFVSTDTLGAGGPRRMDGGLPNLGFMKLKAGSDLIDKGADVGLAYVGSLPDLGAYEYGSTVTVADRSGKRRAAVLRAIRADGSGAFDAAGRHIAAPVFKHGFLLPRP